MQSLVIAPEVQSNHIAAEAWVPRIRPHMETAVKSVITIGLEFIAAKEALPHGEFGRLAELLHVSDRTIQRFMAIAHHPVLADPTRVSVLPASITTLYELSRYGTEALEAAIGSGLVHPGMERKDATVLGAEVAAQKGAPLADPPDYRYCCWTCHTLGYVRFSGPARRRRKNGTGPDLVPWVDRAAYRVANKTRINEARRRPVKEGLSMARESLPPPPLEGIG